MVPARVFAGTSRVFVKQSVDVMTTPTTHLGASAASSKVNDADLAAHGAPSSSNKKKSLALTLRSGRTMPLRRFQMVGVVVDGKKNSNTASLDDGTGVVKVAFEQKAGTAAAGTLASLRVGEVIVVHCSEAQVVASKKRRSNSDAYTKSENGNQTQHKDKTHQKHKQTQTTKITNPTNNQHLNSNDLLNITNVFLMIMPCFFSKTYVFIERLLSC